MTPHGSNKILDLVIRTLVVISVTWTSLCMILFIRNAWISRTLPDSLAGNPVFGGILPTASPSTIYAELPGITQSLSLLAPTLKSNEHRSSTPVRIAVVLQYDSTCFIEVTRVSDCGCSADKLDRYRLTRDAIDPFTGNLLVRQNDEDLSAEMITQYLGGLTKNWRSRL